MKAKSNTSERKGSKEETVLLRKFWKQHGGTLVEEFRAVGGGQNQSPRYIDGVIIHGGPLRRAKASRVRGESLQGKRVTSVQVKTGRLGMYLLGQAFFSKHLLERFNPASVESVALCEQGDAVLQPIFEQYPGCRVVTAADLGKTKRPEKHLRASP